MDAKKEHFVSQFYLRRFSAEGRISVYDKSLGRSFASNVRDVASERFFYDLPQIDTIAGTPQTVERYFQPFEEAGALAIRQLVEAAQQSEVVVVTPEIRIDLSLFIALQHLRTRETREVIVQAGDSLAKELFLDFLRRTRPAVQMDRDWLKMESSEERRRTLHALVILDEDVRERVALAFFQDYWLLFRNSTGRSFYTSDHPVAHHNAILKQPLAAPMIGAVGSEVAFPLSPDLLLVMFDRTAFPQARSADGTVVDMTEPSNVEYYNSLQVLYSYRQVYADRPDFDLASDMRRETPGMGDIGFRRVDLRWGV